MALRFMLFMGLLCKMRMELVQGVINLQLRKAVIAFGAAIIWQHGFMAAL